MTNNATLPARYAESLREYVLKEDYLEAKAGTVFYPCHLCNYGCKHDDERMLGEECLSLTEDRKGGYPFLIVPASKLDERPRSD